MAFYFVINEIQASSDSELNLEIQLDILGEEKSHEESPHKNVEHMTEAFSLKIMNRVVHGFEDFF